MIVVTITHLFSFIRDREIESLRYCSRWNAKPEIYFDPIHHQHQNSVVGKVRGVCFPRTKATDPLLFSGLISCSRIMVDKTK
jgi:hypothetical protein